MVDYDCGFTVIAIIWCLRGFCPINEWYITVVTWALVVCLIYTPSGLRPACFGCMYQANHSCPYYNCIIYMLTLKNLGKYVLSGRIDSIPKDKDIINSLMLRIHRPECQKGNTMGVFFTSDMIRPMPHFNLIVVLLRLTLPTVSEQMQ